MPQRSQDRRIDRLPRVGGDHHLPAGPNHAHRRLDRARRGVEVDDRILIAAPSGLADRAVREREALRGDRGLRIVGEKPRPRVAKPQGKRGGERRDAAADHRHERFAAEAEPPLERRCGGDQWREDRAIVVDRFGDLRKLRRGDRDELGQPAVAAEESGDRAIRARRREAAAARGADAAGHRGVGDHADAGGGPAIAASLDDAAEERSRHAREAATSCKVEMVLGGEQHATHPHERFMRCRCGDGKRDDRRLRGAGDDRRGLHGLSPMLPNGSGR